MPLESWFNIVWSSGLTLMFGYVVVHDDPTHMARVHLAPILGMSSIGLIELLVHWNVFLPGNIEVLAFELAFFMKAVLTYNDLDALTIVENTAHVLVVLNTVGAMAGVLLQCS